MKQEKITAEQVEQRCAELGFVISKPGFSQYLADEFNKPIEIPFSEFPRVPEECFIYVRTLMDYAQYVSGSYVGR